MDTLDDFKRLMLNKHQGYDESGWVGLTESDRMLRTALSVLGWYRFRYVDVPTPGPYHLMRLQPDFDAAVAVLDAWRIDTSLSRDDQRLQAVQQMTRLWEYKRGRRCPKPRLTDGGDWTL
jgi:hypothetical protein